LLVDVDIDILPRQMILGVVLGLGAAFWFGMYTLLVRISQSYSDSPKSAPNVAIISLTSAALLVGVCLAQGESLAIPTARDAVWLFMYGLISQGIGWLLIAGGLPKVPAFVAGMAILIMPTLSFIWDILLFARPTGFLGMGGAILALVSIWMGVTGKYSVKDAVTESTKNEQDARIQKRLEAKTPQARTNVHPKHSFFSTNAKK
jgi:drug/metabolite transporter (DMT)-like permease